MRYEFYDGYSWDQKERQRDYYKSQRILLRLLVFCFHPNAANNGQQNVLRLTRKVLPVFKFFSHVTKMDFFSLPEHNKFQLRRSCTLRVPSSPCHPQLAGRRWTPAAGNGIYFKMFPSLSVPCCSPVTQPSGRWKDQITLLLFVGLKFWSSNTTFQIKEIIFITGKGENKRAAQQAGLCHSLCCIILIFANYLSVFFTKLWAPLETVFSSHSVSLAFHSVSHIGRYMIEVCWNELNEVKDHKIKGGCAYML